MKVNINKDAVFSRATALDLLAIALGSSFWVISTICFVMPNSLLSSGLTGIAIMLNYAWPVLPVSAVVYALNIPVLIWARKEINLRFILYTVYAVTLQSIFLEAFKYFPTYTGDTMLACIFGGLIGGVGAGFVIRRRGSGGGSDVIGIVIKKRYGYSVGTVGNIINAFIIGLSSILYGLEIAMYTFIFIGVCNFATDKAIEGLSKRYSAMIVSEKPREMKDEIFQRIHRGVTFIDGSGAFSGVRRQIIFCVVNQYELATLKDIIYEVDPHAFMSLAETKEVYGTFFQKSAKHREDVKKLEDQALAQVLAPRTPRDLYEYGKQAKKTGPPQKDANEQSPR
ncbi:MAG: YitT family protein [Bacillota bacterium]|nr:YitT family protein [Bacillota bacterium]